MKGILTARRNLFPLCNLPILRYLGWGFAVLTCAVILAGARQYPPAAPPPKPLVLPAPAVRTLHNGLRVVVLERHTLPALTLRLVVEAGAEADPAARPGTAQLVSGLLTEGTATRSALQLADTIDSIGGLVDSGADWDSSFLTLTVLNDHEQLAFDLLADMAAHPAFAPSEVERIRKQTLSGLEVMHDDPTYLADVAFREMVFRGTAYSHPEDGTPEAVRRITPDDLRAFHTRYYRPSQAILAVVGDIATSTAFEQAEKYFGPWAEASQVAPRSIGADAGLPIASGQVPPGATARLGENNKQGSAEFPGSGNSAARAGENEKAAEFLQTETLRYPTAAETPRIVAIDKPDAVQTEIRIGNLGAPRASPDYYALSVANQILGGPASNRLFRALRTRQGLTYGASSDLFCYRTLGAWVAKTFTRTPETMKSLHVSLDQMKSMRDHPISEAELEAARGYLIGHMALDFETSDGVADRLLDLMVHNLPLDYWNRYPDQIRALTADQVWNATKRYLDPDRNVVVLVGAVAGLGKDLKKLGAVQVIPLANVDFGAPDLRRAGNEVAK